MLCSILYTFLWFGAQSSRVWFAIRSNRFGSSCPAGQVSSCLLTGFFVFFFFLTLTPFFVFLLVALKFSFLSLSLPPIQTGSRQDLLAVSNKMKP